MPQIKQSCVVSNGGQVVTLGGNYSTRIKKNSIFMVDGLLVPYTVAADSTFDGIDTTVVLTGAYQGVSDAGAPGVFVTDFTYPDMVPTIAQGDVGTAAVFTAAMYRLQDMIKSVSPTGFAHYQEYYDSVVTMQADVTAKAAAAVAAATGAAASQTAALASKNASAASATGAATSATTATTKATLAQDWATKTDSEVTTGQGYGAKKYANDASASASAAATSATGAAASATGAATSATTATTKATNAATSETNAASSATAAAGSATAASTSATNAAAAATTATTKATNAGTSESNAASSATAAAASATTATTKATNAATSETNAAASATTATTKAANASTSETNALASKNAAATSATNAATSEANALTSKDAAATSATNAAASETNSATSAATATTKATAAATSETNALASKNAAASSATAAQSSADAAAASAAQAVAGQLQSDWTVTDTAAKNYIKNKPTLSAVATSGAKADIGLSNVDNVSDANKPVSTAAQAALDLKAPLTGAGASGTWGIGVTGNAATATKLATARTINGVSFDGSSNIALAKSDIGLGNVDNTPDANKPISTAQAAALALKAPLDSPTFTGPVNVPNVAAGNNTSLAANTAFVTAAVAQGKADILGSAPAALDTLNEFAAALGNDANFATTTATAMGNRLRVDVATQGLTAGQKANAATNLGLAAVATSGAKADVNLGNVDNTSDASKPVSTAQAAAIALKQDAATKDASGGFAGLTAFKLNLKNAAGSITSFLTNAATVARTWTFPDKDGTVALLSDITGTNSGTNTGDETTATIKSKLGISTLSGSNTGDQTLASLGAVSKTGDTMSNTLTLDTTAAGGFSLYLRNTANNGAQVYMLGSGATTPSKTVRVRSGSLEVVNDAQSAIIWGMSDSGATTQTGAATVTSNGLPNSTSAAAITTFGSWGGGFKMVDGTLHGMTYLESSVWKWGFGSGGAITAAMTLTTGGVLSAAQYNGSGAGLTGYAGSLMAGNTAQVSGAAWQDVVWTGRQTFTCNKGNNTYSGSQSYYSGVMYSNDGGAAAMSFLREGQFGVNMGLDPDGFIRIGGWSVAASRFSFGLSAGDFYAAGNIVAYSDERLKTNWRNLQPTFISEWAQVKHGVYDRIDTGETQVGLSAQGVQKVLPFAVTEQGDELRTLALNYGGAAAVATVQLAQEAMLLRAELRQQAALLDILMKKAGLK